MECDHPGKTFIPFLVGGAKGPGIWMVGTGPKKVENHYSKLMLMLSYLLFGLYKILRFTTNQICRQT